MDLRKILLVGILVFGSMTNAHANLDDGLILHYPFEGNTNDVSGNGYHGTDAGS